MSRRWFRHEGRQVFVGWDRSLQSCFLSIAELCKNCNGFGEEPDSDNFCGVCGGDGIQLQPHADARRDGTGAGSARHPVP
jgi:hypothetical protein